MSIRVWLFAVGAAALVAVAAVFFVGIDRQAVNQDQGEARTAAFARLSTDRHTIDRIEFFGWNADSGSAGIVMRGNRNGDYQISWRMIDPTTGQALVEGRKMVSLGPGRRTVVIGLARGTLVSTYREKVLGGAGGVAVDEAFRLAATVEPALSPEESAALPPDEVQNLALGQSSLRSDAGVDVRLSFQLPTAPAAQTD